jgi:ribonuclease T1
MRFLKFFQPILLALCLLASGPLAARNDAAFSGNTISRSALPSEARDTLRLIERGGPFPYSRDGIEFQNRERRLPAQRRGYYREYTVPTPGERSRGARRIISGSEREYYYTADHYRSFQRIIQ